MTFTIPMYNASRFQVTYLVMPQGYKTEHALVGSACLQLRLFCLAVVAVELVCRLDAAAVYCPVDAVASLSCHSLFVGGAVVGLCIFCGGLVAAGLAVNYSSCRRLSSSPM
ncbi:hypothetical protein U1Q18_029165 [Sarracenia purpurea var. burkii]